MLKHILIVTIGLALVPLLIPSTTEAQPPEHRSIVDVALEVNAETGEFSVLIAALAKADNEGNAGLLPLLDSRRQFTVFAPTDEAFDAAAVAILGEGSTGEQLVEALPAADLIAILTYHVAPGFRDADDVQESQRVRTVSRSFVFPQVTDDGLFLRDVDSLGLGSVDAKVVSANNFADNGVIHGISFVLIP